MARGARASTAPRVLDHAAPAPSDSRIEIAASLMCADYRKLTRQLSDLHRAGVTRLHLDFADGDFVPSLILGVEVFRLLEGEERFVVESHMMIREPARFASQFAPSSHIVIVHLEACSHPTDAIRAIRDLGARTGLALNPSTPAAALEPLLEDIDQVVIMTVEPGFAGAPLVEGAIPKVAAVRRLVEASGRAIDIEVDGAVNPATIPALVAGGANVFVGGSSGLFVGGVGLEEAAAQMFAAARAGC